MRIQMPLVGWDETVCLGADPAVPISPFIGRLKIKD
jgi:hypothetical protein